MPAVAGLNVFPVTPGPLNVPPAGVPDNVMEEPLTQTGPYVPALTVGNAFTVTFTASEAVHAPDVTVTV